MRSESDAFLWDVEQARNRIVEFVAGVSETDYRGDDLRRSAVERQLMVIGEALNPLRKVDDVTAALIPDIQRIIGLRNILAHGYAVVDDRVVWAAATRRVPELVKVVQAARSS